MGIWDEATTPSSSNAPSSKGAFAAATTPAPQAASVWDTATGVQKTKTTSIIPPPISPYFSAVDSSGNSYGFSDETDPSGLPYFAYRNPGDTATTTDKTRVAFRVDPRVATPTPTSLRATPRDVAGEAAQRVITDAGPNEQIDHQMALGVGGSNNPLNLKKVPTAQNQGASHLEGTLADEIDNGNISMFNAQIQEAKAKGLPLPWTGQKTDAQAAASYVTAIKNGLGTAGMLVYNTLTHAFEDAKPPVKPVPPVAAAPAAPTGGLFSDIKSTNIDLSNPGLSISNPSFGISKSTQAVGDDQTPNITPESVLKSGVNYEKDFLAGPANTTGGTVRNTIIDLLTGVKSKEKVLNAMGQGSMRGFAAVASALTQKPFIPQGKFQQQLYGTDQPITATSFGRETRLADPQKKSTGLFKNIDPALGVVAGVADAIPGIEDAAGLLGLTQNARRAIAETDDAAKISELLKQEIPNLSAENADTFANIFKHINNESDVDTAINRINFEINQPKVPDVAPEAIPSEASASQTVTTQPAPAPVRPVADSSTKYQGNLPAIAFDNSKNQRIIAGTNFSIGDYGTNAIERKTSSGQEDRLPVAQLADTIPHITNTYTAGDTSFRKDNLVHVATMPNGDYRAIVTRKNAFGQEEVINFFKVGRPIEPFIKNLKSFGVPDRTRTDIASLERSKPNPLADGDKINVPETNKTVNTPPVYNNEGAVTTKILDDLKGKRAVSKQYILDATNRPELKQQERDIVRSVLADYPDGSQVPVQEFADKVKAELLPLKTSVYGSVQLGGTKPAKYEGTTLSDIDGLRGPVTNYAEKIYTSPIETSAGKNHFPDSKNYFGHTRVEDIPGNTRRIIEVQSDLYQKGNLERETKMRVVRANKDIPYNLSKETPAEVEAKFKVAEDKAQKEVNQLQQYTNPTAHFRMVREELKQAAVDGKTAVQFPTGTTAMKIEGLGAGNNIFRNPHPRGGFSGITKPEDLKVGGELLDRSHKNWIVTDVLGDGKFKAVPKELANSSGDIEQFIKDLPNKPEYIRNHQESFDISGKVDTNNPIYKFYEKDLGRYLTSKFGAKVITDKQGVSWYQVPVDKEMAKAGVSAFGEPKAGYKAVSEIREAKPYEKFDYYNRTTDSSALKLKFKARGFLKFPNVRISTPGDVAFAFDFLRNNVAESFYVVGLKDDKPISIELISIGTINSSLVDPYAVSPLLRAKGADGVYLVHNHPSGDVRASQQDIDAQYRLTESLKDFGIGIKGQVIIDTDKYGFITPAGDAKVIPLPDEMLPRESRAPIFEKYQEWQDKNVGPAIADSDDAVSLMKGLTIDWKNNSVAFLLNTQLHVNSTIVLPNTIRGDIQKLALKLISAAQDSVSTSIVLGNLPISQFDFKKLSDILSERHNITLQDAVIMDGDKYKSVQAGGPVKASDTTSKIQEESETPAKTLFNQPKISESADEPFPSQHSDFDQAAEALEQKRYELENKKEILRNNPMRHLEKYVSSSGENKGQLPEFGVGKSEFSKRGDQIVDDVLGHGRDVEDERENFNTKYLKSKQEIKDLSADIRKTAERLKQTAITARIEAENDRISKLNPDITKANKGVYPLPARGGLVAPEIVWSTLKDRPTLFLSRDTMERNLEKIGNRQQAKEINDFLVNPIRENELAKVKYNNEIRLEVRAKTKELGIKINSDADALIQVFGEGRMTLTELEAASPKQWKEIQQAADYFRKLYDRLIDNWNYARSLYGYAPVGKRPDYFRHFNEINEWTKNFGFITNDKNLPTEIAGKTITFKPGKPFSTAEMHRTGDRTKFSAIGGMDNYLDSVSRQMFHIDSIQRGKAVISYLEDAAHADPDHVNLPNFMGNLREFTNLVSGKSSTVDQGVASLLGRPVLRFLQKTTDLFSKNVILGNISSAISHTIPAVLNVSTTAKASYAKGLYDTALAPLRPGALTHIDGMESSFLVRRYPERAIQLTNFKKAEETLGFLFQHVDQFISRQAVASKYFENISNGMSNEEAIKKADNYAQRVIGDRSIGNLPNLLNTKTLGFITMFQTEINDNLSVLLHDVSEWAKDDLENKGLVLTSTDGGKTYAFHGNKGKYYTKILGALLSFAIATHLYNILIKQTTGSGKGIDPIDWLETALGLDDESEGKSFKERVQAAGTDAMGELPFTSMFTGDFPIKQPITDLLGVLWSIATLNPDHSKIIKSIANFASPVGGGDQALKTYQGVQAYENGYVTNSAGATSFDIDKTPGNAIKSTLFGQYSTKSAQDFFNGVSVAQQEYDKIVKSSDPAAAFASLKQKDPATAKQVASIAEDNKLGLTDEDKKIRSLGVANGARALALLSKFNALKTKQEKEALWEEYVTKKIITTDVAAQLVSLFGKQGN